MDKGIICWTHPRACSTAFERSFMTRKDVRCIHEPFGDAYYYGEERLSPRFSESDCRQSPYRNATYKGILDQCAESGTSDTNKRIFIKDMAQYIVPLKGKANIAASFGSRQQEPENPTVFPLEVFENYKHAFLIRNPIKAVPSYYRCTIPPLSDRTGFNFFDANEAGYRELELLIRFLKENQIEPRPFILDADDLLYDPESSLEAYCHHVGLSFDPGMLSWAPNEGCDHFKKWEGFHDDAQESTGLARKGEGSREKPIYDLEKERCEWLKKFGQEGAAQIERCVLQNLPIYERLKTLK